MNDTPPVATPRRVGRPAGAAKAAKAKSAPKVAAREPNAPVESLEPTIKDSDQEARAAAAPSWDDGDGKLLTRRSRLKGDALDNWSDVPAELKDAGWDYEWRVLKNLQQETPGAEKSHWYEQGWRPVPARGKWLKMCEPGYSGKYVERYDQMLMTRPLHLSEEARREDFAIAEEQKWNKLEAASAVPTNRPGIVAHRDKMEIDIVVGSKAEKSAASRQ